MTVPTVTATQSKAPTLPPWLTPAYAATLTEEYATPLVVLSLSRVRSNADRITAALRAELGVDVRPTFAVKSCYIVDVIRCLRGLGWGMEVMSGYELTMLLELGVTGSEITLTGLGWGDELCRRAVDAGVRRFVVDSGADLDSLSRASSTSTPSSVLIRANLSDAHSNAFFAPDAKLGQTGVDNLVAMVGEVHLRPQLRFVGLHMHQFNRLAAVGPYRSAVRALSRTADLLRQRGFGVEELDVGGGWESVARLDRASQPVELFAAALGELAPSVATVATEFGRAVVGDAAVVVSRVRAVKVNAGRCWVIVDASTNTLVPVPGAVFDPVSLAPRTDRRAERCCFTDGTGSPVELAHAVEMPRPDVGDLVVLTECGAYTTVFTELWAAAIPTMILIQVDDSISVRGSAAVSQGTYQAWYAQAAWDRAAPVSPSKSPPTRQSV